MLLSSTLLLLLDLVIFALVLRRRLAGKNLLDDCSLLLLACQAVVRAVRCTRNDGADLAELRDVVLSAVFLEELLARCYNIAHTQNLEIPLELRRKVGAWQVEPEWGLGIAS